MAGLKIFRRLAEMLDFDETNKTAGYSIVVNATEDGYELADVSGGGGGSDDQTAAEVPFTPAGTIAATDTQAAVEEVATDAAAALTTHAADTSSVHGIADTSALLDTGDLGSTVQPYDADLAAVAALSPTNDDVLQRKAGAWTNRSIAQLLVDLGLSSLYQAKDTTLDTYAGIDPSANVQSLLGAVDYAAIRTLLGLVIGTDVQAHDADLDTWAGLTPSAFFQTLADDADAATARATLGVIASLFENGGAQELSLAGLGGTPTELTNHLADAADAHAASAITNTPAGNIAATTVQAAIDELDSEKTTAAAALTAAQTEIADQKRTVEILVTDPAGSAITTGDGKAYFRVPTLLNGHNLVSVGASVSTVSSSGTPTIQLRRLRLTNATTQSAADMLTTKLTIDASEFDSKDAATAAVIDTSNDDVQTGDQINVDIDVAGTGAKGLVVTMTFEAP